MFRFLVLFFELDKVQKYELKNNLVWIVRNSHRCVIAYSANTFVYHCKRISSDLQYIYFWIEGIFKQLIALADIIWS